MVYQVLSRDAGFPPKGFTPIKRKRPISRRGIFPIGKRGRSARKGGSRYWRAKARAVFMAMYRGRPCAVCGKTEGTVAHHIVPVSVCPCHCCEPKMVVVLCPVCHGRAHSGDVDKRRLLEQWLYLYRPGQIRWATEHKHDGRRRDWRAVYLGLVDGTRPALGFNRA